MASTVLLVLLAGCIGGLVAAWLGDPDGMDAAELLLSVLAFLFVSIGWLLARRGRTQSGVLVAVAGLEGAVWLLFATAATLDDSVLYFLSIPVLVGGLLLRPRGAIVVAAGTLASVAILDPLVDSLHGQPPVAAPDLTLGILLTILATIAVSASWLLEGDLRTLEQRTAQLEAATGELERRSAERRRMLSQVSHDMAHPLDPISIQLKMLARPGGAADPPHALAIIQRNVDQLKQRVEDLKDLSRIEGKALRLAPARVDLSALAAEAVESLRPSAEQLRVHLELAAPEPLPVWADGSRLTQVLYNLVRNAIKFTPAGGGIVVRVGTGDGCVRVAVQDTGRGLAPEEIPLLFRPFSQAHGPGEVAERGTGLGLYIAKGIVEAHGGRIGVESPGKGRGATFTFQLPLPQPGPAA
jgi:signal transduction histidine kinase